MTGDPWRLIGMYDSPFVRRVAISLTLLGQPFEHLNWSVGRDFARIRRFNPLGRVPTLVLDGAERTDGSIDPNRVLHESALILEYLDAGAGERALLAPHGAARWEALALMATAIGAAEKGRDQIYERVFRAPAERSATWLARVSEQMHAALGMLEQVWQTRAVPAGRLGQAEITTACVLTFLVESVPLPDLPARYPALARLRAACEARPEFIATHAPWFAPAG